MNLYLTSTANGVRKIPRLKQLIDGRTKLVVLPFAHDFNWLSCAEDVWEKYDRCLKAKNSIFWKTVKPFIDMGIDVKNIVIINHFADPVPLIKQKLLANNTIVFLPGGRPENIMKILQALTLTETIKRCRIVVGESAGSMIWSKYYFVYPDQDYPKYQKFKGLGLIKNCVFVPHYCVYGPKKHILKAAKRFSWFHKEDIYLTEDDGWVRYDTSSDRVIGYYKAIKFKKYF